MKKCQKPNNSKMQETRNHSASEVRARKLYNCTQRIDFLQKCLINRKIPKCCRINTLVLKTTKWSKKKVHEVELKNLEKLLLLEKQKYEKLNNLFNNSCKNLPFSEKTSLKQKTFDKCKKTYYKTDNKRTKKLNNLVDNLKSVKIKIFNDSNLQIPENITEIVSLGPGQSYGSKVNELTLLRQFERLNCAWVEHAKKVGLSEITIFETKSKINAQFSEMKNLKSNQYNKISQVKFFLKQNPDYLFVPIDKSKNFNFMSKAAYIDKLNQEFTDKTEIYSRIKNNPLDKELLRFGRCINTIKEFISKKTFYSIKPNHRLKSAYGLIKRHKENHPIRPIISSKNSLTSGAELFVLSILKKFPTKFSLNSSRDFKDKFINERKNIDKNHKIASFDVKSLYPSVNVGFTVSYIIKEIYKTKKNQKFYFQNNLNDEQKLSIIPKKIFEKFLLDILTDFTCFTSLCGFFKQKSGLSMGSSVSSIVSNIYLDIIESKIIAPKLEKSKLSMYHRYVDDVILSGPEDILNSTFDELNNFHTNLKFTREDMIENLPFLDTILYFDKTTNQYELQNYQKETKSDNLVNFNSSVSPINSKKGTLIGECYRMKNTCTTENNLNLALKKVEKKHIENGYPKNYVKSIIQDVKNRDFKPKERKIDYKKLKKEFPDRFHCFTYNYIDYGCERVAKNIQKIIKKVTPLFNVSFAWRSTTLNQVILPSLKQKIEILNQPACVYKFECPCNEAVYIGETLRQVKTRISEHNSKSKTVKSEVANHILNCQPYQNALKNEYPNLNRTTGLSFLKKHFCVLETNLTNYFNRQIAESLYICVEKPNLNIQGNSKRLETLR